jgi:RNA polymerase sigma factor (sigma-70 family)
LTARFSRNAFDELYRLHAPNVQRRASALLGNEADAWEVVQDVFVSLYERPEQFRGDSKLSTYLYSATTHACLNRIRLHRNRRNLLAERKAETPMSQSNTLDPEALSLLHDVLRRVPEELALVAAYYYVDDLSHDEIARLVGCSRRQVGNLLERVVQKARELEAAPC